VLGSDYSRSDQAQDTHDRYGLPRNLDIRARPPKLKGNLPGKQELEANCNHGEDKPKLANRIELTVSAQVALGYLIAVLAAHWFVRSSGWLEGRRWHVTAVSCAA
jgi:hypothetical protein